MSDDDAGFGNLWIEVYGPIAGEPQFRIGWCARDDGAALTDNPYTPFTTPYHAWNAEYLASKQQVVDDYDDDFYDEDGDGDDED
jgi:hypothetical protein